MQLRPKLCTGLSLFLIAFFNPSLFGNGFNLHSLGARAAGMGGAYIGLADDYSAVFWNPAGLIQLKDKTFGLSIKGLSPFLSWKSDHPDPYPPDIDADTDFGIFLSGLVSYSFSLGNNLVAGISAYIPSDLATRWGSPGPYADSRSRLLVRALSPAVALRINKALSIGATFNLCYGTFSAKWPIDSRRYSENSSGLGFGATVGLLFTPPDEIFSLGITLKTGYKIRLKGEAEMFFLPEDPDVSPRSDFYRDISWPWSIGFGVAVRPRDRLIVTADFLWTNWTSVNKIAIEYKNADWKRLNDAPPYTKDIGLLWDHTLEFRMGGEYLFKEGIALRAGYFYDDSPSSGSRLSFLLPSLPHHGMTMGIGLKKGKVQYDFGLEYLIGTEQKIDLGKPYFESFDGNTFIATISATYRFK